MVEKKIRQPQQLRAIDKKNKIIETAYEVFSEIGYYATNTTDIAKRAGVSTGIVYGYFKDKRDILLYVLEIYLRKLRDPVTECLAKMRSVEDLSDTVEEMIDVTVELHRSNANLHNILQSLAITDPEINKHFLELEDRLTADISNKLRDVGFDTKDLSEAVHLAMNAARSFAHEYIYDRHAYLDYAVMRKWVADTMKSFFRPLPPQQR